MILALCMCVYFLLSVTGAPTGASKQQLVCKQKITKQLCNKLCILRENNICKIQCTKNNFCKSTRKSSKKITKKPITHHMHAPSFRPHTFLPIHAPAVLHSSPSIHSPALKCQHIPINVNKGTVTGCIQQNIIVNFYNDVIETNNLPQVHPECLAFASSISNELCLSVYNYSGLYNKLSTIYNNNKAIFDLQGGTVLSTYKKFAYLYECVKNVTEFQCDKTCYKDLSSADSIIAEISTFEDEFTQGQDGIYHFSSICNSVKVYYLTIVYSGNFYLYMQQLDNLYNNLYPTCRGNYFACLDNAIAESNDASFECSSAKLDCEDECISLYAPEDCGNNCDTDYDDCESKLTSTLEDDSKECYSEYLDNCIKPFCDFYNAFDFINKTVPIKYNPSSEYTAMYSASSMYDISNATTQDTILLNAPYTCFDTSEYLDP